MVAKKSSKFTEEDGHTLAADMLREIRQHWYARETPDMPDEELDVLGRRDDSRIFRRYRATLRRARSAALSRGFYAVLTDYIGTIDRAFYEDKPKQGARHG